MRPPRRVDAVPSPSAQCAPNRYFGAENCGEMPRGRPTAFPLSREYAMRCSALLVAPLVVVWTLACCAPSFLTQELYVDEPGLLAGLARPTHPAVSVPAWDDADDGALLPRLLARLEEMGLEPVVVSTSNGATCTAVAARVRARRADGKEALLLSARVGGSSCGMRTGALVLEVGALLGRVKWLAKDVLLLLFVSPPRAADEAVTAAGDGCDVHPPLRDFLRAHTGEGALSRTSPGNNNETWRGGGVLRQAVHIGLCPHDSYPRADGAIGVSLAGANGRMPNLDMYSALRKIAAQHGVRAPLVLLDTWHVGMQPGTWHASTSSWPAPYPWREGARLLHAIAISARGVPLGPHAVPLSLGIDAITIRAAPVDARAVRSGDRGDGRHVAQATAFLIWHAHSILNILVWQPPPSYCDHLPRSIPMARSYGSLSCTCARSQICTRRSTIRITSVRARQQRHMLMLLLL